MTTFPMNAPTTSVGVNLRRVRSEQQLSLATVAEQASISVATLSRIETSKQNVDVTLLLTLARILGVPPAEILGSSEELDETGTLARAFSRLRTPDRARIFMDSSRKRNGNQVGAVVDDLLATIDVLREELLNVQRAVKRRPKR
jgi:transcriptional regulator with XRE-family HTH domain